VELVELWLGTLAVRLMEALCPGTSAVKPMEARSSHPQEPVPDRPSSTLLNQVHIPNQQH